MDFINNRTYAYRQSQQTLNKTNSTSKITVNLDFNQKSEIKAEDNNTVKMKTKNTENSENSENLDENKNSSHSKTPIFIGFGSMVIENPKGLLQVLLQGAALANIRVIVQAGWSEISSEEFNNIAKEAEKQARLAYLLEEEEEEIEDEISEEFEGDRGGEEGKGSKSKSKSEGELKGDKNSNFNSDNITYAPENQKSEKSEKSEKKVAWTAACDALLIGSCPHSWLFNQVAAVVHHGGAG